MSPPAKVPGGVMSASMKSVKVFPQFSQGSRNAVRITNWRSETLSRLTKSQNERGKKNQKSKKSNERTELESLIERKKRKRRKIIRPDEWRVGIYERSLQQHVPGKWDQNSGVEEKKNWIFRSLV